MKKDVFNIFFYFKKISKKDMDNINLVESFSEIKELKNIDKSTMKVVMQDVFKTIITKRYGSSDNFDIIVNPNKGDLEIWRNREIVEDNFDEFDENIHIKLSDAVKIEPDFEVGEDVADEVKIADFGRRAISSIKQILKSKIIDLGKEKLFNQYKDREGELISVEVQQVLRKEVIAFDDFGNEFILPKADQLFKDFFRKGDNIRAIISNVEMVNNNLKMILSRTSNAFVEKLFEMEIPEVFDGLIVVKGVSREPGVKSKVAVESYDDRVDPVGLCVGVKGSRIQSIIRELGGENIDVINYTTNKTLYVARALNQTKYSSVIFNEEKRSVDFTLPADQLSMAIGKGGLNIKLASKLVGYKIDIYSDDALPVEDVMLDDFTDEIDGWIIDELKKIGCDTAKSVLKLSFTELVTRTDLEEETVREIISTLENEFN